MSIRDEIRARLDEERLRLIKPLMPGSPEARLIYASDELHKAIRLPHADPQEAARRGRLQADFDRFINGRLVTIGGRNHRQAYMKCLEPECDEIWEIRSIDPRPSLRVFGSFAEADVFIAMHIGRRDELGGFNSPEFKAAIRYTKACWRQLFNTWPPFSGSTINDYITENVLDLRTFG
jgi:hypothetical protein